MWSDRKIIILLVAVQLLLCVFTVHSFPISLDEPFSIFHAQYPLGEMIQEIGKGNNSPLHFILLHFCVKIGGISLWSVRALSIMVSLVSVVYLFKLGRKFLKPISAVLLVGLFIFSRTNHFIAMEARMYGLFTLFFILILYHFYQLLFTDKKVFLQLAIWNALLMYTHYLGGVVLLLECIVFICFYKNWTKQNLIQVLLTFVVGILLFIPGIRFFLNRASNFKSNGTWVPETTFVDLWTNLVKLLNNQFTFFTTLLMVLLLLVYRKKILNITKMKQVHFFLIWFVGGYILMFLISVFIQPIFIIKYIQFLTIPMFIVLASILNWFNGEGNKKYLPLLIWIPFALSFKAFPDVNRNTDELLAYVKEGKQEGTIVYYSPPFYDLTIAYHYNQAYFKSYKETRALMLKDSFFPIYSSQDFKIVLPGQQIIFIDFESEFIYPNNNILNDLNKNYLFVDSKAFKGGFNVYCYQVP